MVAHAMRLLAHLLALLALVSLTAQPAHAQSVLRDTETERLLNELAAPLIEAAGLEPDNVEIVLVNDPSINAFVAGGQIVYLHSGLIDAAEDAGEVQGVIAHELGHITGGHINRYEEGIAQAGSISILSLLLGAAALAAGQGEAAAGILGMGQRAAIGQFLAFSRVQEASADAAGAEYLSIAGISGRGSLTFFNRLLNQEFRYYRDQSDEAAFNRSHPLSGDRISALRQTYESDPAWDAPTDPVMQERFVRMKAKLFGYLAEPHRTFETYPASMAGVPARYARAYAYHQQALTAEALEEAEALLETAPQDPYFLELYGQILLESGEVERAIPPLREATRHSGSAPLIAAMFGHALIATEDEANHTEAEEVLRASVGRDRRNPFAWYQLGIIYAQSGDQARARLASAEQQAMTQRWPEALLSAQYAEANLPTGTPDWIRAQDIVLQARFELERARDRR